MDFLLETCLESLKENNKKGFKNSFYKEEAEEVVTLQEEQRELQRKTLQEVLEIRDKQVTICNKALLKGLKGLPLVVQSFDIDTLSLVVLPNGTWYDDQYQFFVSFYEDCMSFMGNPECGVEVYPNIYLLYAGPDQQSEQTINWPFILHINEHADVKSFVSLLESEVIFPTHKEKQQIKFSRDILKMWQERIKS